MRLPSSLVGKNGNCPACKNTVLITNPQGSIDQVINPDISSSVATPNTSEAPVKQPSSPAEQIRNRLLLLKQGKHEFANAEMLRSQAVESLNQSREDVSRLFSAIGSQIAMAYTLGEIKETPSLMNLIAANRKLMDVQNESAMLTPGPNAGIVEKTKAKAKQLALGGKIKTLEGQIENQQFELGKEIYESRNWDVYTSNTTSEIFQELNSLEQNIANAQNRLDQASSAFEDLKRSLSNSIPLNAIQDISTFEMAIGLSERQLAELEGTPPPSSINKPVQTDPQIGHGVSSPSRDRKKSPPIKFISALTFVSIIAVGLYFVFTSNLLRSTPDIDDYGQSVLAAWKSQDFEQYWNTRLNFEEIAKVTEEYNKIATTKVPLSISRDLEGKAKIKFSPDFMKECVKLPDDAKYLACDPGQKRNFKYWQSEGYTDLKALEQLGYESTNNGRVFAYDDTHLYTMFLDRGYKTPRGWFSGAGVGGIGKVPIAELNKTDARKELENLTSGEIPDDMHPLGIEARIRVNQFILDF